MLHIEPYHSLSEESEGEAAVSDNDSGSIKDYTKLFDAENKPKDRDHDSEAEADRQNTKIVKSRRSKRRSKEKKRDEKYRKYHRPATAPRPQSRARSSRAIHPGSEGPWQQEHVVSFINCPPFPTSAKSMRIPIPGDTHVETRNHGTQYKIKTRNRTLQAAPVTVSVHCQTSGLIEKETATPTGTLDNMITSLTAIYSLLKDVDIKAEDVKEQEDQAMKLLEDISDKQTPFNIDESEIIEIRDTLVKMNALMDNKEGIDGKAENLVVFIDRGVVSLREQIENLDQRLSGLSAPVIQSGDGEQIALTMGNYENTLRECLNDLKSTLQQINNNCDKLENHLSDIEGQLDKRSDPNSEQVLDKVNDIYDILMTGQRQNPMVHKVRRPYSGPCKCASIKNGFPKEMNTAVNVDEQYNLCQKCFNDYRGRVFVHIHNLPSATNETAHSTLGQILECLECDNNVELVNFLRSFRSQVPSWQDADFSRFYVALFKCSLGWNNVRCPGVLASYLDIGALIHIHFTDEEGPLDLDVLGQLLCRIDVSDRRILLNTGNLQTLLFNAVCSCNVTAFRFLANNFAPLGQIRNGRSVLHEIVNQAFIHKDSDKAGQWNDAMLQMTEIFYERASFWWEWHSGAQAIPDGPAQAEPSSDSSENDNTDGNQTPQYGIIPKYKVEQSTNKEDMKQNALRYLLNIKDDSSRCPLQYAIQFGPESIVKKIISEPPYQFLPDPLEFMQCSRQMGFIVNDIEGRFAPRGQSILDRLTLRQPLEASPILTSEPFNGMLQDKWRWYSIFAWIWFLLYIYYMAVYTACVIHRPLGRTTVSELHQNTGDKIRLAGEVMIWCGLLLYIYAEIRDYLRLGWVWPWPWTFHGLPRLVNILFVIFTITAIILRFTFNENEDIMLALALLFGWMNSIYFLVLWRPTRIMPYVLHVIFTREICGNFLIIFFITMIALSVSTYCICQELFDTAFENNNEEGFWFYPYTLYKLIAGVDDTDYVLRSRNLDMGYTLFVVFIWIMIFFLVKVLIAMVVHAYLKIKNDENKYDIWIKAWMIQLTERRLLPFMYIRYGEDKSCMDKFRKAKLQYGVRYDLRKDSQGRMMEVPQHAVLVPMEP